MLIAAVQKAQVLLVTGPTGPPGPTGATGPTGGPVADLAETLSNSDLTYYATMAQVLAVIWIVAVFQTNLFDASAVTKRRELGWFVALAVLFPVAEGALIIHLGSGQPMSLFWTSFVYVAFGAFLGAVSMQPLESSMHRWKRLSTKSAPAPETQAKGGGRPEEVETDKARETEDQSDQ